MTFEEKYDLRKRSMGNYMKISKDECDKEFAEKKLVLSDEKCKQCEYLYLCPFMSQAMDEVTNGDDGF